MRAASGTRRQLIQLRLPAMVRVSVTLMESVARLGPSTVATAIIRAVLLEMAQSMAFKAFRLSIVSGVGSFCSRRRRSHWFRIRVLVEIHSCIGRPSKSFLWRLSPTINTSRIFSSISLNLFRISNISVGGIKVEWGVADPKENVISKAKAFQMLISGNGGVENFVTLASEIKSESAFCPVQFDQGSHFSIIRKMKSEPVHVLFRNERGSNGGSWRENRGIGGSFAFPFVG